MSVKMKVILSIIIAVFAGVLLFSVLNNKKDAPETPRELLTINDVLNKPKEKLLLIDKINPKEQYAIGVVVQSTPLSERNKLKTKKLSEIIEIYENKTGEKIPSGEIKDARVLKYKELSIESSKILFALTVSEEDRSIMEIYMAKRFLSPDKMREINEQTVGTIIDSAKAEMPDLYKKLIAYTKLKKENKIKEAIDKKNNEPIIKQNN